MSEKLTMEGKRVFESLSVDDKRALKHFLTGQIQNILANEHGIGGKKETMTRVEKSVQTTLGSANYLDQVAERLVKIRRIDIDKVIIAAVQAAAKKKLEERIGKALEKIHFSIVLEPEPLEGGNPKGFGEF